MGSVQLRVFIPPSFPPHRALSARHNGECRISEGPMWLSDKKNQAQCTAVIPALDSDA